MRKFFYAFGCLILLGVMTSHASAQSRFLRSRYMRSVYTPYGYNPYVSPYVANAQALATQQFYNAAVTQSNVQYSYYGNPYYQQSMYYPAPYYGNAYNPWAYGNPYGTVYGSPPLSPPVIAPYGYGN